MKVAIIAAMLAVLVGGVPLGLAAEGTIKCCVPPRKCVDVKDRWECARISGQIVQDCKQCR